MNSTGTERPEAFWIATGDLPRSEGHVFYRKLNALLREAEFDPFVEGLCQPHYHKSTEIILAAPVYHADESDANTLGSTISEAQTHLVAAASQAEIEEVVADKGYHKNETLVELEFTEGLRTYVAEPKHSRRRNWTNKPPEQRQAAANNRRRIRGDRGRALQRQRSEKVERSFAHVRQTGGARRAWLWGIENVRKRHLMAAMAHNLGVLMRGLFGMGTARALQAALPTL